MNELIQNIWETMQAAYGVGLAASQVGLPIRLFVVDSTLAVDEEKGEVGIRTVFINAEAISQ